jgi:phosphoadenosine phosphosulfate reductase
MALVENTLFGVDDKVKRAIQNMRATEYQNPCLKFSGGKDSQVIYHLAKEAGVSFRAQYDLTTVDPPELVDFIRENYPDVVINRPKTTMWRLIVKKRMPPTRLIRYCCDVFKEQGCPNHSLIITGVRWKESRRRSKRGMWETCQAQKGSEFFNPIIDWAESDVWEYLNDNNIPHCSLYDEGWKRIGCIGCPMADTKIREREFARYPKYRDAYIRSFDRMLKAIKDYKGANWQASTKWKTAEDVFHWFMYGAEKDYKRIPEGELFKGDYYEQYYRESEAWLYQQSGT